MAPFTIVVLGLILVETKTNQTGVSGIWVGRLIGVGGDMAVILIESQLIETKASSKMSNICPLS